MSRKIVSTLVSVFVIISSISVFAYSDCNHEAVTSLTELNVLSGYEDGTFKPDTLLSRAEFSKIISLVSGGKNIADLNITPQFENAFSDVTASHWAFNYIIHCNSLKLLEGYEDGSFKPDENVSLAEAAKICLSAIDYSILITEETDEWYVPWLDLAYEYKIINNKDETPDRKISRLEAASIIFRTINLPLCRVTGYDFSVNPPVMQFDFADGTTDKDGKEKPFVSLLTLYFQ